MNKQEKDILKNIMQIRLVKKLTQKEISDKLHISEATYNRIESGKIALSYKHLANIASELNISIIDVITWPETYVPCIEPKSTKVLVELDVSTDEFIKMGLKDKVIQVLNK
ncbi:MAG: helix-turn-helix domain-containing protein [Bacteroidales bacterium]|jgi:transcriptional regulator with XRE-family HTH domain|nr:helix-turn-helix domain-containing protein [Bacteroidales bacterium]